jgi:hypothetical protein
LGVEWKLHRESATAVRFTLNTNVAAEMVRYLTGQGETESRTVGAGGTLGTVEALEDVGYLCLGYPTSVVSDAHEGVAVLAVQVDLHGLATFTSARVLESVIK